MKFCKKHNFNFETHDCLLCKRDRNQRYYKNNKDKLVEQAKEYSKVYYLENKENINARHKEYVENNREQISEYNKNYQRENKEVIAQQQKNYREINKEQINHTKSIWASKKRKSDPLFKLRADMSSAICHMLKANSSSKGDGSTLDFLLYTIEELKEYLEKQFEPWMNWGNQGKYDPTTWNDDDPTTWTWQLDHIIPQASLPYSSMNDENFKKCWALENLRPLSAKQNLLDGSTRKRHI